MRMRLDQYLEDALKLERLKQAEEIQPSVDSDYHSRQKPRAPMP